jgi:hypothetical protein
MRQFALGQVSAFVEQAHPGLRQTQLVNLCLVVHALVACGRPCLSAVARCLSGPSRLIHRIKRVYRFVNNPRLPRERLATQLACLNWAHGATGRPRVIIDYTDLGNGYVSLWAALACRGRSVPLLGRLLPRTITEGSRNAAENALILELQALFGTGWVLLGDRGFARASLLELLNAQGIDYVIRIDDHTAIYTREGRQLVSRLPVGRKRRLWLGLVRYHSHDKVPTHLLVCQRQGHRWNLASSLDDPDRIHQLYQTRMQIEEMFRDLKQHLRIERLPCHTAERYATWLLLVAMAYSYLYWLGQLAQKAGLSNLYHYWKAESVFWLGLQLLLHADPAVPRLTRRLLSRFRESG